MPLTDALTKTQRQRSRVFQQAKVTEEQDQQQFFKDLGATAEQTVEEVRGVEENYFASMQRMLMVFPWLADLNSRLQNYAEQNFADALNFSHDLSRAQDIQDFARINVEFAQKSFESVVEQAQDFVETCTAWQRRQLRQLTFCSSLNEITASALSGSYAAT